MRHQYDHWFLCIILQESKGFKVVARNVSSLVAVRTSRDGVQYREGGATIVIPVQYTGENDYKSMSVLACVCVRAHSCIIS